MASKEVREIVIKTSASGAPQTAAQLKQVSGEVARLKKEAAKGGGAVGGIKGLNEQAKAFNLTGDSSVISLLRGGGGLTIVGLLTTALEGLAKEITEHTKRVKQGWTQLESILSLTRHVPVAGPLGESITGIGDALGQDSLLEVLKKEIFGIRPSNRTAAEQDKLDEKRATQNKAAEQRDAMRERSRAFLEQSREAAQGARDDVRTLGLSGPSLEREQRQIEFERTQRQLKKEKDDLERQKRFLTDVDREEFDRNQLIQLNAAKRKRDAPVSEPFQSNRIDIPSTSNLTGAGGQDFSRLVQIQKEQAADARRSREALEKLVAQGSKPATPQLR